MIKTIENNAMRIQFQEDLIAPNVKEMENKMFRYIEEAKEVDEVTVEMSEIENIDSVGITFIIGMYKMVTKDGRLFRVIGCNDDMKQLFKLMRLDDFFDIED